VQTGKSEELLSTRIEDTVRQKTLLLLHPRRKGKQEEVE
jgi:hypothetical protein